MRSIFLTTDLMFFSRVASIAGEHEWDLLTLSSHDEALYRASEKPCALFLIDLTTREIDFSELISDLKGLETPPQHFVAFGPHVHTAKLDAAREAGCDEVLTRGQFDANMVEILGKYLTVSE